MRKKTFDLLCNVGELTGLFQKSTNIRGLLHLTVKIISKHMQTEACSIFLVEKETGDLIPRTDESERLPRFYPDPGKYSAAAGPLEKSGGFFLV
jgi:hypothetical protein